MMDMYFGYWDEQMDGQGFILTVLAHGSFFSLSAYVSVRASVRVCHYVWAQALCYSYVSYNVMLHTR